MHWLLLAIIGLITGLFGAMLGVGGSILLIPALNELRGTQQHAHQACAMIVTLCVAVPAAWHYYRAGLVHGPITVRMLPAAVVSVVAGVAASESPVFTGPREAYLVLLFGAFLLGVMLYNLLRLHQTSGREDNITPTGRQTWKPAVLVGLPTGFIAGLLGVGGGLVAVPLQQTLLGLPMKRCIANSTVLICGIGLVGALTKNAAWARMAPERQFEPLELAVVLAPTVLAGSLLGSHLTTFMPARVLRWMFVAVLLVAGLRQTSRGFLAVPEAQENVTLYQEGH